MPKKPKLKPVAAVSDAKRKPAAAAPEPKRKPGRPPKQPADGDPGLQRQTIYLHHDEWEHVRRIAYENRTNCSNIVRQALRQFFEMDKPRK